MLNQAAELIFESGIKLSLPNESGCLLTWPEKICPQQHSQIIHLQAQIQSDIQSKVIKGLFDVVVSYNSLMIYYDFLQLSTINLVDYLKPQINALSREKSFPQDSSNIIKIPVCYHESLAWDLKEVATRLSLSCDEVISAHQEGLYHAYALGFTPGFCYLGTLPSKLELPRRATPRTQVPAGAVAIAEKQTAVYPSPSPGGWHIIGQTPIALYEVSEHSFTPKIPVGCQVQFEAISLTEYQSLLSQLSEGKSGMGK